MRSSGMPAAAAISSERSKKTRRSSTMSRSGSIATRLCIMTRPAPAVATTAAIAASPCRPHWSLTIAAPASSASRAIEAFVVSIETATSMLEISAASTGARRARSSAASTGAKPGRVDSAPTSMMPAPPAKWRRASAIAASGARNRPPSENESGVTLTMPIRIGTPRGASSARASLPLASGVTRLDRSVCRPPSARHGRPRPGHGEKRAAS